MGYKDYRFDGGGFDPMSRFNRAPAVKLLIIANFAIYVLELILKAVSMSMKSPVYEQFVNLFSLVPQLVTTKFFLWQFITANFLHFDFSHIFFNMLGLFFFGPELEALWGKKKFLRVCLTIGLLAYLFAYALSIHSPVPILGASGVVMGVLGAFAAINPNAQIIVLFYPVKAKYLAIFYFIIATLGTLGLEGGGPVAHSVHLAGIVLGVAYVKVRFRFLDNFYYDMKERLRLWRLRRKYKNFRVVDKDVKKMWDDLEDRINHEDGRNRHIN